LGKMGTSRLDEKAESERNFMEPKKDLEGRRATQTRHVKGNYQPEPWGVREIWCRREKRRAKIAVPSGHEKGERTQGKNPRLTDESSWEDIDHQHVKDYSSRGTLAMAARCR